MRTSDLRDSAVSPARAVHSLRIGKKAVLCWKSRKTLNWTAEIPFWQMTNRQIATSKAVKNSSWLANIVPWVTPNANSRPHLGLATIHDGASASTPSV
jgi:hypothetical protein